jgi:hypothetical protein
MSNARLLGGKLETALSAIGALGLNDAVVAATFLAGSSTSDVELLPVPDPTDLRHFISALQTPGVDRDAVEKIVSLRHVDAVLLASVMRGNSETLSLAAIAYVILVKLAPDAHDRLVFETIVHKLVNIATRAVPRKGSRAASKKRSLKKGVNSTEIQGEDGASIDDVDVNAESTSEQLVDVLDEARSEDVSNFWIQLVSTIETTALGSEDTDFAGVAAYGLTGLLRIAATHKMFALAESGFRALLIPGRHSRTTGDLIRALYGALMPIVVSGKISAACRASITKILPPIVQLDGCEGLAGKLSAHNSQSHRSTLKTPSKHVQVANHSFGSSSPSTPLNQGAHEDADPLCSTPKPASPQSSPKPKKQTTVAFLQAVCMRPLERMEERTAVATLLMSLLNHLETSDVEHFIRFISKLAQQPRSLHRLFAVELSLQALQYSKQSYDSICLLMNTFHDRSADKVPAVRGKAIACLSTALQCLSNEESRGDIVRSSVLSILAPGFDLDSRSEDSKSGVRKSVVQLILVTAQCILKDSIWKAFAETDISMINSPVRLCSQIASPNCSPDRAIQLLSALLRGRCEDIIPTVRRVAMHGLTTLVQQLFGSQNTFSTDITRERALALWLEGVLPRVVDSEVAVQDVSLDNFESLLLSEFASNHSSRIPNCTGLAEGFLASLSNGDSAAGRYSSLALSLILSKREIDPNVISALQERVLSPTKFPSENPVVALGAWTMLADIIETDPKKRCTSVLRSTTITELALSGTGGRHSCRIASVIAADIPVGERKQLASKFLEYLTSLCSRTDDPAAAFSIDVIPGMVAALASLDPQSGDILLQHCDSGFTANGHLWNEVRLISAVVITGEVCASFPLQSEPPSRLVNYLQALMDSRQPERVRAMAIASMGKLCFCEATDVDGNVSSSKRVSFGERLARRCVPLFVRELNDGCSIAARINALIVLCDMCRRYTAIVEPHVGRLAMCLRDSSETVRQRAVASLASLFQEDYLKLRGGPIFFRLVLSLLDSKPEMRCSVEYVLSQLLLPKAPLLFATNFVETLFVVNSCQAHPIYNKYLRCAEEENADALLTQALGHRLKAYRWLLARIPLDQRVGLSSRLRQDILMPISEQKLSITDPHVDRVLADALLLLASPELRLLTTSDDDENDAENGIEGSNVEAPIESTTDPSRTKTSASTKGKLLARIYQIELKEETIPLLLELKRCMEKLRSPLLANVRTCLCEVLKPYRKELDSLIDDSTLRAEIKFDLRDDTELRRHAGQTNSKTLTDVTNSPTNLRRSNLVRSSHRTPAGQSHASSGPDIVGSHSRHRLATALQASPKLASIAKSRRQDVLHFNVGSAESHDWTGLVRILEM